MSLSQVSLVNFYAIVILMQSRRVSQDLKPTIVVERLDRMLANFLTRRCTANEPNKELFFKQIF
jgi:hypothetical protein